MVAVDRNASNFGTAGLDLRCARNDGELHKHIPSRDAKRARVADERFAPGKIKMEGVGNAGCPLHPQPRARLVVVEAHE